MSKCFIHMLSPQDGAARRPMPEESGRRNAGAMPDLNNFHMESMPEAAVLVRRWLVESANALARHYLPALEPGRPLPRELRPLIEIHSDGGTFTAGRSTYQFRRTNGEEEGDALLLFCPAPQTALTDGQLDGALRQLRQLLSELMAQCGSQPQSAGAVQKSLHRMFRLLDNLELLRACSGGGGLYLRPVTLDLAGLCRQTSEEANTVLREIGVSVACETPASLLISGDPELLRRMLLELIANSARAAGHGTVWLRLRPQGDRAVLTISDSGAPLTQRQLAAMLEQDAGDQLPLPGQGAGLGMAVVRRIAALHQGAVLVEWSHGAPTVIFSLPAGPGEARTQVQTPALQRDGGLSPLLVALSDLLPAALFEQEGRD